MKIRAGRFLRARTAFVMDSAYHYVRTDCMRHAIAYTRARSKSRASVILQNLGPPGGGLSIGDLRCSMINRDLGFGSSGGSYPMVWVLPKTQNDLF